VPRSLLRSLVALGPRPRVVAGRVKNQFAKLRVRKLLVALAERVSVVFADRLLPPKRHRSHTIEDFDGTTQLSSRSGRWEGMKRRLFVGAGYRGAPVVIDEPPPRPNAIKRVWNAFRALPLRKKWPIIVAFYYVVVITIGSPVYGLCAAPCAALAVKLIFRICEKGGKS